MIGFSTVAEAEALDVGFSVEICAQAANKTATAIVIAKELAWVFMVLLKVIRIAS